jgi:hypothetical protein
MSHVSRVLFFSDRLHSMKCSGSGSGSEVSTPHAGAGPSLTFCHALVGDGDTGSNAVSDVVVASDCSAVRENGVSSAKKAKISIQASSVSSNDSTAFSTSADIQKVVPTSADLLSLAVEIKRNNPGCGVKKVLLEILHKHPDWAITEHRVGKLLHENGLANVKRPSSVTTDSSGQPSFHHQQRAEDNVPDIHFDILSLPQPHAELWQAPPSPSSQNSGSLQQSAGIVDLDKLFEPLKCQQVPIAVDASDFEGAAGTASNCSKLIDLDKLFANASVPTTNAHEWSDV